MEGDYRGATMVGRLWRGTMEGKLWRRLNIEGKLSWATMEGDYGGATMEVLDYGW